MKRRKRFISNMHGSDMSRRQFLGMGLLALAACALPGSVFAFTDDLLSPERTLAFLNIHTDEFLSATYWVEGRYDEAALEDVDLILRDYRTDEVKPIDRELLDLLYVMKCTIECEEPFHVISGYRSPETNSWLKSIGRGVARNSLHIEGKAIDIRVPGQKLKTLRDIALDLGAGGVGYYPKSDFVHVDTGKVRDW